jgi:hypothetical protein
VIDVTLSGGIPQSINTNNTFTTSGQGNSFTGVERITATLVNAQVAQLGGDTQIQFGRLTGGNASFVAVNTFTQNGQPAGGGTSGPFSTTLASNQSSHYVIGVPATALPTAGSFIYNLAGATSPTFADGSGLPGTFTGTLNILFGAQTLGSSAVTSGLNGVVVGLDATVTMPGDTSYRLLTTGGLNLASQLAQLQSGGSSTGTITGSAVGGFSGNPLVVVSPGSRACGSGMCNAVVLGFLAGTNGARAGIVYALGNFNQSNGQFNLSQIIQGAAAFKR